MPKGIGYFKPSPVSKFKKQVKVKPKDVCD
uniref:ORF9 n=1 Tax=Nitrosopumilaceae spindle-shaped virus TaxID=3065433 RepID=A0AAT9J9R8_9VIRU